MSETKGQCRREFESHYADKQVIPRQCDWFLADAIDRIAAEVAAIKAKVDSVEPEDNGKFIPPELETIFCQSLSAKAWNEIVDRKTAAIRERDEARAEVERLKAELAARPAAAGWLTDRERQTLLYLRSMLSSWANAPFNYPEVRGFACNNLECLDAILSRAGSPPVVVLPTVFQHSSLGDKLVALQQVKDALDKAGVAWKEVGRE